MVLHGRPLVVEHRRAGDTQHRGRDARVVGAVPERDVEAARRRARPRAPSASARPSAKRARRPWPPAARPVTADRGVRHIEALAQLERLGEVARGHAHVMAVGAQQLDQGAHDEHVRAVGQVDPDRASRADGNAAGATRLPGAAVSWTGRARACLVGETVVDESVALRRRSGLPGIFALMAISCACMPIPSEVVMLFAGFAVADPGQSAHTAPHDDDRRHAGGPASGRWSARGSRTASGVGGAWSSSNVTVHKIHMGPGQIQRADGWFPRYGEIAVLVGRLIPVVQGVRVAAGRDRADARSRGSAVSLVGAIPWVIGLAFGGEALGERLGERAQRVRVRRLRDRRAGRRADRVRGRAPAAACAGRRPMPPAERGIPPQRRAAAPRRRARPAAGTRPSCCPSPPPRTRTLVPWLAGWPYAELEPERARGASRSRCTPGGGPRLGDRMRGELRRRARTLNRAGGGRVIALARATCARGYHASGGPIERQLGRAALDRAGLTGGAVAMALADARHPGGGKLRVCARGGAARATGSRSGSHSRGALVPGVSRNGATLAASRARGSSSAPPPTLSAGAVALPVIAGASALKGGPPAARGSAGSELRAPLLAGVASSFCSTLAHQPRSCAGSLSRRPLAPYSLYRCLLAAAVLGARALAAAEGSRMPGLGSVMVGAIASSQ